jgi:hypothetical protein
MTNGRQTFDLGLVMAGAVSAGAYTAGVLDFLFEALDALEDARSGGDTAPLTAGLPEENPVFDPGHDVRIGAMAGASAGAMVTAIATTLLGTRVPPIGPGRRPDAASVGNPLYDAWVSEIHYDRLLGTADLAGGAPLRSLLDASALDAIVRRALAYSQRTDRVRSYVAERLPIYLCVSNLRGIRYSLSLDAEPDAGTEHQMSMHADHVGFCWHARPGGEGLPGLRSLAPGGDQGPWDQLGASALASGAFPVGLSAREVKRRFSDYEERQWYDPGQLLNPVRRRDKNGQEVVPSEDPASWLSRAGAGVTLPPVDRSVDHPGGVYDFVNVDGGVFNNEPLELCRTALAGPGGRNPRDPAEATRSVLLIDPFPNLFELDRAYDAEKERRLLVVLKRLVGAFTAQSRFKPDELALARDPGVASRAAIMPVRYEEPGNRKARYAIACGALGGFGGFLSKEFRHHDYMLGRRNCQRFLMRHLALPADPENGTENPLFARWPRDARLREPFAFRKTYRGADGVERQVLHLPIVPLLGRLASPDYTATPPWPVTPADLQLEDLRARIEARANGVKAALVRELRPTIWFRAAIEAVWWRKRDQWIERFAMAPIRSDLQSRSHNIR